MKTKYAIIIALLVLAIIGFASAYLITFNQAKKTVTSTDDSGIIKMVPWFNKASNETVSFEVVWGNKNKAPESDEWIILKQAPESQIISLAIIWGNKAPMDCFGCV